MQSTNQPENLQESSFVAMNVEYQAAPLSHPSSEPATTVWLKRLIDCGTQYVPQTLTPVQFRTLQALTRILSPFTSHRAASRMDAASRIDAALVASAGDIEDVDGNQPITFDYQLGLDEIETITRTRTGFTFSELPQELQEAVLSLISSRDLTTRRLDLALWLDNLRLQAQPAF